MRKIYFNALAILLSFIAFNCYGQTHSWSPVGPIAFPINDIATINGHGRISQIKFDPINSSRVYAVGPHGVFVSNNNTDNWSVLGTDALPASTLFASICIDRTNNNILYIGTGDANYFNSFNSSGVWKSIDGGATFQLMNTGMGNRLVTEILMSPTDSNILVAATNNGIYRTTNGGANWVLVSAIDQFADMRIAPENGSTTIYAATSNNGNFYKSTDMGATWTSRNINGILQSRGGRVAVSPADSNMVYVAFVGSNTTAGKGSIVYKSSDRGTTFTMQKGDVQPNLAGYSATGNGQGNYNFDLEADPNNANTIYIDAHVIWRSTDGGVNWAKTYTSTYNGTIHTDMHGLRFNPYNTSQLFNVNDGGVWVSTDNASTWAPKCQGLIATEFYHMANSSVKKYLIGGGTQDNGELYTKDGVWHCNRSADFTSRYAADHSTGMMYYLNDNGGKKRNIDTNPTGGITSLGLPRAVASTDQFAFSFHNTNVAYASQAAFGVYRTTNLQTNPSAWTSIWVPPTSVLAIGVSPSDSNVVYVLSKNKSIVRTDNAMSASPAFVSVTAAPTSVSFPLNGTLAVLKTGVVYMSVEGNVFRSHDRGVVWTEAGTGAVTNTLKTQRVLTLLADTSHSNIEAVYALTSQAVYYKDNTMADWAYFTNNLPLIAKLTDLDIYYDPISVNNSLLRVSTYGRGVWESPLANNVASPNQVPVVSIKTPFDGANFNTDQTFTVTSTATDADGFISKVEYFLNGISIGEAYSPPYLVSANAPTTGNYTLTAVATDNKWHAAASATSNLSITASKCTATADIPQTNLKVIYFDSQEIKGQEVVGWEYHPATYAIDGNTNTYWQSKFQDGDDPLPHEIQLSLGDTYRVRQFKYLQIGLYGRVKDYEIYVSMDSLNWGRPVAIGSFENTMTEKLVLFGEKKGKFLRFKALSEYNGTQYTAAAELKVGGCPWVDNIAPVISATALVNHCYESSGNYNIPAISANDDDSGINHITYQVTGATNRSGAGENASGNFNAGESTIVWTVTDHSGNTSTAQTKVIIDQLLTASVEDVYAVNQGVEANTIYLGYGSSSLTYVALVQGGTAPYTYSWSNGVANASTEVNPITSGAHTYSVTITDALGCSVTVTKQVKVVDIRSADGKVFVCHNGNNIISVSVNAVPAHLSQGDKLGICNSLDGAEVTTYPNPFENELYIKLPAGKEGDKVNYEIYDVMNKKLMVKSATVITSGQITIAGASNLPSGQYLVKLNVDNKNLAVRVVK